MPDWVRYRAWKFARRIEMWQQDVLEQQQKGGAQCNAEFAAAAEQSRIALAQLAVSLPYTADRALLSSALTDAAAALVAQLKVDLPSPSKIAVCNLGASSEALGRANFAMLLQELDNAVDDVLTLSNEEDKMEFF
jgi:hypothetical protein